MDLYQREELELSASQQLDVNGMQPHAREYLEYELNSCRSERCLSKIEGEWIDHVPGIQFSGRP